MIKYLDAIVATISNKQPVEVHCDAAWILKLALTTTSRSKCISCLTTAWHNLYSTSVHRRIYTCELLSDDRLNRETQSYSRNAFDSSQVCVCKPVRYVIHLHTTYN